MSVQSKHICWKDHNSAASTASTVDTFNAHPQLFPLFFNLCNCRAPGPSPPFLVYNDVHMMHQFFPGSYLLKGLMSMHLNNDISFICAIRK